MKKILIIILGFLWGFANAQLKLGNNTATIDVNSLLELESSTKLLVLSSASLSSTTNRSPYSVTLKTGALVWNTNAAITAGSSSYPVAAGGVGLYVWDGSGWKTLAWSMADADLLSRANHTGTQTAATISDFSSAVAATAALKANNLSDLSSATTARTNLGLGSLSTLSNVNNSNWSGTALAIANGGTGATTQQAAINALAGAVTNALFLRGNGTNVTMSAIQASDIPTLNQNTTGTAANVTGTVAIGNGGTGATTAATARTNLGATTVGANLFTLTNPSAITFPRFNADNTVSALDAATFRTAIGAGTSSTTGTVTSVGGTGTVSGLSLSGTVTTTGNLTLGGTLAVTPSNFASQTANTILSAPNGSAGVPTFRALVAADIPTLNQNTTGTAANVTGTVAIGNGGTGATTAATARTNLGATTVGANLFTLTNPTAVTFPRFNADNTVSALDAATFRTAIGAGTSSTTGTVTSVGLTMPTGFTVSSSPITNSGTIGVSFTTGQTANQFLATPNGTTGAMSLRSIVAADIPTLNQNTTGTAANVTGTVAIGNGGTGATTQQAAINALAGAVTNALFLRGNGTNVTMSAIQASDIPTLNQNTTGTAANVTGTVAIGNGGTGATTAATARTNLGATTVGSSIFTLTNPSAVTFPRFNADNTVSALDAATFRTAIGAGTGNGSGTVTSVAMTVPSFLSISGSPVTSSGTLALSLSGTALPVANGGTGSTTGAGLLSGLTSGYIPRATAANTLVNGVIQDNGSQVGIGQAPNASYRLAINGATYVTPDGNAVGLYFNGTSAFRGSASMYFDGDFTGVGGEIYFRIGSSGAYEAIRVSGASSGNVPRTIFTGGIKLNPSAAPATPANGAMYYDSTTHKFRGYANGSWVDLH